MQDAKRANLEALVNLPGMEMDSSSDLEKMRLGTRAGLTFEQTESLTLADLRSLNNLSQLDTLSDFT